jgi:ferredoxin--NADP+ reductase
MKPNEIINKKEIAPNVKLFDIYAPDIAKKCLPGNFIILMTSEQGERIPLTINDYDRSKGTIRIIVQEVGKTTQELGEMDKGDTLPNLMGPLGHPSEIEYFGKVVCIGGGVGNAVVYPVARELKNKGNEIIGIIGAKTKELVILENEMKKICSNLYITTDDGSYGKKGFVTDALNEVLSAEKINRVIAIGPIIMMKKVSEITKQKNIPTIVSLNPIMIDGTGMCGGCRVSVGNETKFACVDGPEFDGHKVDFDELIHRNNRFQEEEKHECKLLNQWKKDL